MVNRNRSIMGCQLNKHAKCLALAILATFLIIPIAVYAKRVGPEQAQQAAQRFADNKQASQTKGYVRLKHIAVKARQKHAGNVGGALKKNLESTGEDTLYYVFGLSESDNGGFVIVAADDVASPILGFSTGGNYDERNLPPNFVYWMDYLSRQIAFANEQGFTQSEDTKQLWKKGSFAPTKIVGDTLKTKWGQDAPYNNNTPNNNPTGCVATAMAQIMKKYGYPTRGNGSKNGIEFNVDYDWKNMKDVYDGTANATQNNAVATLMRHAGASVDMAYGSNASGAFVTNAMIALVTYFGYGNAMKSISRASYNKETEWHAEIRKQLDDNRPILYSGNKLDWVFGSVGHAFVCDAYDKESNYFHFNWGWDGECDGWYLTTSLDPKNAVGAFNDAQSAIINIKPGLVDNSYSLIGQFRASKTGGSYAKDIGDDGLTVLYPGDKFYIGAFGYGDGKEDILVYNNTTRDFPGGNLGVALLDDKNNFVEIIGVTWKLIYAIDALTGGGNLTSIQGWRIANSVECRLPDNIAPGKYKIKAAFLPFDGRSEDAWQIFDINEPIVKEGKWEIMDGSFNAEVSNTTVEITVVLPDITSKFVDPNFRKAICDLIGKPTSGLIYGQDVGNITNLNVSNLGIKDLSGIEYFTALKSLNCSNNSLTSLDVSKNIALQSLDCSNNSLKSLNVSGNKLTMDAVTAPNQLQVVKRATGVPAAVALKKLYCNNNKLKMLDVTGIKIEELKCDSNFMLNSSWVTGVPATSKFMFLPQKTDITKEFTDANFLAAVRNEIGKKAGEPILTTDVSDIYLINVSGSITGKIIKNLDGIEHLVGLGMFYCDNNELTELDVSNNIGLHLLWCCYNNLSKLDVSNNILLTELHCQHNKLTTLDISNNTLLVVLICNENRLTELDMSNITDLSRLICCDNKIESLKLPMQPKPERLQLGWLDCSRNKLTKLDLSSYRDAYWLFCDNNQLTKLILPRGVIYTLTCYNNNLDSLFISSLTNMEIEYLNVSENYLASESAVSGFSGVWDDNEFVFTPQKKRRETTVAVTAESANPYGGAAHLVTFVSDSGDKMGMQLVQNGKSALPPKPTKEGYVLVWDKDYSNVTSDMTLIARWADVTAVQTNDRVVPDVKSETNAAIVSPIVTASQDELTFGPNPIAKSVGKVGIFWQGKRVFDCELRIYDAAGNFVNVIKIRDKNHSNLQKRQVGSWDLKDAKGRVVSEGTYAVRGVINTADGKTGKVSTVVGVW